MVLARLVLREPTLDLPWVQGGDYPQIVLWTVFTAGNVYGWKCWLDDKRKLKPTWGG